MNYEEALEWLRGERSCWNDRTWLAQESSRAALLAESAREDAAQTQRAYWVVRAHREGLVGGRQRSEAYGLAVDMASAAYARGRCEVLGQGGDSDYIAQAAEMHRRQIACEKRLREALE